MLLGMEDKATWNISIPYDGIMNSDFLGTLFMIPTIRFGRLGDIKTHLSIL